MEGKPWMDQLRRKTQRATVGVLNGASKHSLLVMSLGSVVRAPLLNPPTLSHTPSTLLHILCSNLFWSLFHITF